MSELVANTRFADRVPKIDLQLLEQGKAELPRVLEIMGYDGLREGQDGVIHMILAGRDVLCVLPTSTGKTACFVVPALCHDWNVLVFSPLQALMRDQVQNLSKLWKDKMHLFPSMYKGPPVNYMSGQKSDLENNLAAQMWGQGELNLLYVAPERLANENFQRALEAVPPDMVVLDEAHCLSEWGHNFRSDYRKVGDLVQNLQPLVVSAFTATCTPPVERDVRQVLGIQQAQREAHFRRRENLLLKSEPYVDDFHLAGKIRENQAEMGGSQIVYCGTQEGTEELAEFLGVQLNQEVGAFHGGMPQAQKRLWQDRFMADEIRVMTCTNAFGMGVDKGNVRGVYHRQFPGSPEALIQEVGRAGRDGLDSECLTLDDPKTMQLHRFFIQTGYPIEQDVRALFEVMRARAGQDGILQLTGFELSKLSGIHGKHVEAIMQILKGDLVIERTTAEEKICKIKFVGENSDNRYTEMRTLVPSLGVQDSGGAYELDLLELPGKLGKSEATVRGWLRNWDKEGFVEFTPPFKGSTTKIIGTPDNVDFERLRYKCEQAYDRLGIVEGYLQIPDEEKHDYVESYFFDTMNDGG